MPHQSKFMLSRTRYLTYAKSLNQQEIVFKKDKATLHVTSKICENTVNYYN